MHYDVYFQINWNTVECFLDELVIKTWQRKYHLEHLQAMFDKFREHQ